MTEAQTQTITKPVKLAFLGVGWIGKNRMDAVANCDFATVEAICDVSQDNIEMAKKGLPQVGIYNKIEELLELDVDGLVIATPSAMHAEQTEAALKKGLSVFCQKPLGRNFEENNRVVQVAKQQNKLLGVDFSYRYTCFRKVYDLIQSGELGDIFSIELVFHNAYGPDKSWFYDPKLSGGGCVIDLGVHLVDAALWALDYPEVTDLHSRLYAKGKPLSDPSTQVEDYASANIGLSNGTNLQLTCSWNLPAGKEAEIQINVYGTKGGAAFRNINGSFYDFQALRFYGTKTEVLFEGHDDWGGRAAVDWARKLSEGSAFDPEIENVVKVAKVLDQIYGK
jgi:predicted dehydrogenase